MLDRLLERAQREMLMIFVFSMIVVVVLFNIK